MTFKNMGIIAPLLKAIQKTGYQEPTEIQSRAIPLILKGHDIIACAQTGTGKTAAFALPILQLLHTAKDDRSHPRALVIVPTRELAVQVSESLSSFANALPLRHLAIFGGVSQQQQVAKLKEGLDLIVATPGRLLDLHAQGHLNISKVACLVLDEADNMLDMGFLHDIKKIMSALPKKRQTLLFSATMPQGIRKLAKEMMQHPKEIAVSPVSSTLPTINQSVYLVDKKEKTTLLKQFLNRRTGQQTLVFLRTKHGADRLSKKLLKYGITAVSIHGNKTQNARQKALNSFKEGKVDVLLATDIAARGIDIKELPMVINYDLPEDAETYVHRIGRTGRAGKTGEAHSFCSPEEKSLLLKIQKLIGRQLINK